MQLQFGITFLVIGSCCSNNLLNEDHEVRHKLLSLGSYSWHYQHHGGDGIITCSALPASRQWWHHMHDTPSLTAVMTSHAWPSLTASRRRWHHNMHGPHSQPRGDDGITTCMALTASRRRWHHHMHGPHSHPHGDDGIITCMTLPASRRRWHHHMHGHQSLTATMASSYAWLSQPHGDDCIITCMALPASRQRWHHHMHGPHSLTCSERLKPMKVTVSYIHIKRNLHRVTYLWNIRWANVGRTALPNPLAATTGRLLLLLLS